MRRILAADIGGTNSRFANFSFDGERLHLNNTVWLKSAEASSFAELLNQLADSELGLTPATADASVFAIAGPVLGRTSSPPNISWNIDLDALLPELGCSDALLINDFVAQGYACLSQLAEDAITVVEGSPVAEAPIAVLGAGTGLGKCLLVPLGNGQHKAVPSEGGHATFPFTTPEEVEFADFLRRKRERAVVDGDMVVSGSGFSALYEFHTGEQKSSRETIKTLPDDSPIIQAYSRFYARACKNYALNTLALGGLFVSGGVAAGNPRLITNKYFIQEFQHHDTYHDLLKNIPVRLNRNEESGLWGAAYCGVQNINAAETTRRECI